MSVKKLYTREEFEELRVTWAQQMADDQILKKEALDVLVKADTHNWIHQTTYFGEPILNLPQDMFAIQEIIFKTRPDYIIELGVAWGGALLFYATLMEVLGGGKVIGVDVYMPEDLKKRLLSHKTISNHIILINNSSLHGETVKQIENLVGESKSVLVILDSYHTHDHVLNELNLYAKFVGKGSYMICGDTVVDDIPEQKHRSRPWGPGNNPKTALKAFLQQNKKFKIDTQIEKKLLFTCNPGGYLKCIQD